MLRHSADDSRRISTTRGRRILRHLPCALAALAACLFGRPGVGDDEGHCRPVSGDFMSVVDPDCPEEAVLCTHGLLSGDLEATYDFIMLMLGPHPDDENALIYSGVSVIETGNGHQLFGVDSGVMYPQPDGTAPFTTTVTIVGGTRRSKHAVGEIVAGGVLNLVTGEAAGTYAGAICRDVD